MSRSNPSLRWSAIFLGMLSLSIGWGIRGNFGHEFGAMIAGTLCAIAVCLCSGREDWRRRVLYFAVFALAAGASAVRWRTCCRSVTRTADICPHKSTASWRSSSPGFSGRRWAEPAQPIRPWKSRRSSQNCSRPCVGCSPCGPYTISWKATWPSGISTCGKGPNRSPAISGRRIHSTGSTAIGLRRARRFWACASSICGIVASPSFTCWCCWAQLRLVGWGVQELLVRTGWLTPLLAMLVHPQGDLSAINPATGLPFDPNDLVSNWPQVFFDLGRHWGWIFGLVAGIGVYFTRYGKWRSGASLLMHLTLGGLFAFLLRAGVALESL